MKIELIRPDEIYDNYSRQDWPLVFEYLDRDPMYNAYYWVLISDDQYLDQAFAYLYPREYTPGGAWLSVFEVKKRSQGKGFGTKALQIIEAVCANSGKNSLSLNARQGAEGFYQKCGYNSIRSDTVYTKFFF